MKKIIAFLVPWIFFLIIARCFSIELLWALIFATSSTILFDLHGVLTINAIKNILITVLEAMAQEEDKNAK